MRPRAVDPSQARFPLVQPSAGHYESFHAGPFMATGEALSLLYHYVCDGWYTSLMPTSNERVQVTLDPHFAAALGRLESWQSGRSRGRVIRDLALKAAEAELQADAARQQGLAYLRQIAMGDEPFDFDALQELHDTRREHL